MKLPNIKSDVVSRIFLILAAVSIMASCEKDYSLISGSYTVDKTGELRDPEICAKLYITNLAVEHKVGITHTTNGSDYDFKVSKNATLKSISLKYQIYDRKDFSIINTGSNISDQVQYGQTAAMEILYSSEKGSYDLNPYFSADLEINMLPTMAPAYIDGTADKSYASLDKINCGKIIFATIVPNGIKPQKVTYTEVTLPPGITGKDRTSELRRVATIIDKEILGKSAMEITQSVSTLKVLNAQVTGQYKTLVSDTISTLLVRAQEENVSENKSLPAEVHSALVNHFSKVLKETF